MFGAARLVEWLSPSVPRGFFERPWHGVLDALFPPRCGGCRRFSQSLFCERCAPRVLPLSGSGCEVCGRLFDPLALGAPVCASCRARPPAFQKARAAWVFEGPPRELIHRFKYQRRFALAPRLARALLQTPGARAMLFDWRPQILVPVPLHPSRGRARGFNQSALLARELSNLCGLSHAELLHRVRPTPPQVGLTNAQRRRNVKDAFAVDAALWQSCAVQADGTGARILLIDDVFTTGSTLAECAATLHRAGAAHIGALTVARQQRPDEPRPQRNSTLWEQSVWF